MLFNLSCEEEGFIHVSVPGDDMEELIEWLEQEQGVGVMGSY